MKPWPSEALEDVVCNLCGSHDSRARMVIDGFTIVRCNVCSLDYLNPRLKQGILQEIYDDGYYRSRSLTAPGERHLPQLFNIDRDIPHENARHRLRNERVSPGHRSCMLESVTFGAP